jgi:yecA family protein
MHPVTATDYQELTDRLGSSDLHPSAAEAHGMLCGLICAGEPHAQRRWLSELLAESGSRDLLAQEAAQRLQSLAESTRAEIEGPGLGFTPLLPAEGRPLRERALALYDWARGFLYGLGLAGLDAAGLSEQAREVLADFAAITHMDLDSLTETEENEESLMELEEFVWVAAMLVYEERGRGEEGA